MLLPDGQFGKPMALPRGSTGEHATLGEYDPGTYTFRLSVRDPYRLGKSDLPLELEQMDTVTITIKDLTPPVLVLNEPASFSIEAGGSFQDPGASAFDACDGDLSGAIRTSGSVNVDVPGNYVITYSVLDSSGNLATIARQVDVISITPATSSVIPSIVPARSEAFALTIHGSTFMEGAIVTWNGSPRPTTRVSSTELRASISATDIDTDAEVQLVNISVVNPGGRISNAQVLTVKQTNVGPVQSNVVLPGSTGIVSTAPQTAGETGATATINNGGAQPVLFSAATYESEPSSGAIFGAEASYINLEITGADINDSASLQIYYASTVSVAAEDFLRLSYFDGSKWVPVRGSNNSIPVKSTTDNLDGTASGGRFTVVFDQTSTPKITELTGTVFVVANTTPRVSIVASSKPIPVAASFSASVRYEAIGSSESQVVLIEWGDGHSTTVAGISTGIVSQSHLYTNAGIYTVKAAVTDTNHDTGSAKFESVVVYDANGGFITGGGWIDSATVAYVSQPKTKEKADFSFVAKYKKGSSIPSGEVEFQLHSTNLKFQATSFDWLVISGSSAQLTGRGTINGIGDYLFLISADDKDTGDHFRIKIGGGANGAIVYDNQPGTEATASLQSSALIGGGNIEIHK
jgi:hypothetical protein